MSLTAFKMKNYEASLLQNKINKLKKKYDDLDQISMQGKEGDELLKEIHIAQGELNKVNEWMNRKW